MDMDIGLCSPGIRNDFFLTIIYGYRVLGTFFYSELSLGYGSLGTGVKGSMIA
jgi:hypothetical protein